MATGANVLFVKAKGRGNRVKPAKLSRPKTMKFSGEESFIVSGGIPTKQYLLYLGAAGIERVVPVDSLTDNGETVSINPPALPTFDVLPTDQTPILNPPALPDVPPTDQGPVLNPPILPEMPTGGVKQPVLATFPDWPNLNCEGIKAGLASLRETLMVSKFDIAVRNEYERQILIGEKYLSSCTSGTPTPPPTIVTPTPTVFGGVFPGGIRPAGGTGGAGGGGEDKKKKPFPWWWIVVGGAVLYFLTREKK